MLLNSIVIKPIGSFCNLRCAYCFYLQKHELYEGPPSTHKMNDETLENLIRQMFACSPNPTFAWQGGEPTVLGVEFFEKVVRLQRKHAHGKPYSNALQTAGHLLTADWAEFLRRENFLVGLSMDGPKEIHDHYRKDVHGKGTFERVFANAKMLLEHQVPVNILATVNDCSAQHPREIYHFFVDNGFHFMQFSPVVELNPDNPEIAAPYTVSADAYGRFLTKIFKLWVKDFDFHALKQNTSIRFFDELLKRYVGMQPDHCVLHKHCNQYLVVEHNGDLYSCDFLVSRDTFLGNLHATPLDAAFHSEAHRQFGAMKADYGEECQQCQWLHQCYGGCIKDRLHDPRDGGHNHFCASYKYFFERADKDFRMFADLYRKHYMAAAPVQAIPVRSISLSVKGSRI
ncbi:anaerobic sulfatase maturase [Candidatus Thiothrix sp. Deng01]|uniref:Anaerobic sulfatase maturase n=1 Tax=Candidatus Thiothrix phosphatis TaxID=3112415 RepID=A0ABU6CXI5_9GAMM|nr:anaerobic sulfatase maturase [Candidatus Thiothrix sp. Deng01]MEB4591257.1 anaerobic sulfatase maturase [Candidatus Thiothrix sp. Deng01]